MDRCIRKLTNVLLIIVLVMTFSTIILANSEPVFRLVYIVQEGDNLSTIAKKFETTVTNLRKANGLSEKSVLLVGNELYIPFPGEKLDRQIQLPNGTLFSNAAPELRIMKWEEYPVRLRSEPVKVNIPPGERITYHVKRGDSLFTLAREFQTTVAVIKALNNMERDAIRVGQTLVLPSRGLTAKQVLAKTISERELNLLARVVHGEARGEPYIGKVAVAAVVLNRVLSSSFPNTIEGVIYQRSQFESVTNGQYNLTPDASAYRAAREALSGVDPSLGALFFINPRYARNAWWFDLRQKTVTIGGHVFAR